MMQTQTQPSRSNRNHYSAPASDERGLLLEEVDLKWLMAGQGWWIDTDRFHSDATYAAGILALAQSVPSPAVRHCAAGLQVQIH